jgi:hypothetical protein
MNDWITIFRDAVCAVAGVTVYDTQGNGLLGRYIVAKSMKLANGAFRTTQTYYHQRPAALAYAKKFLQERAEKARVPYAPGDGAKTLGFKPILASSVPN